MYIWLRRALLAGMIVRKCDRFLEIRYALGGVGKRMLIFCWKAEFSVYARRLFVAGDVSRMVSTIYVDWCLDEGSRHRLERAYFSMILLA